MSLYLKSYTRALKRYDGDLFAGRNREGLPCVFRRVKRFVPVCEDDGFRLLNLVEGAQFVFALTDNWSSLGNPRDWGIDYVLQKVKECDALANERFFEELDAKNEAVDQEKARSLRNEMEGFWAYERRRFAKTMDENVGLTHSLSKDEPRKRLKDRSIKNAKY